MELVRMTVADIMVTPVETVAPDLPAREARQRLQRSRIRHLPVVEGGLLLGIVSDRDLRDAAGGSPIATHMTRTVFVLSPETPLRAAARILRERRIGAMPVLRGRQVVGIVSVVDVVRALEDSVRAETSRPSP
jgi:acetoin utilization protein AcuB